MRARASAKDKIFVNIICFTILAVTLAVVFIRFVNKNIEPATIEISGHKAKQETVYIINQTVNNLFKQANMDYSDFASIVYDEDGNITSIDTITKNVNTFQTELSAQINSNLQTALNKVIDVPLGTVSGMYLFSGKGPNIKVKLIPLGDVKTQLKSEFTSAGINQTRHRIIVDISVQVTTVLPLDTEVVNVSYEFVLAETVIVGKVPENYITMPEIDQGQ